MRLSYISDVSFRSKACFSLQRVRKRIEMLKEKCCCHNAENISDYNQFAQQNTNQKHPRERKIAAYV